MCHVAVGCQCKCVVLMDVSVDVSCCWMSVWMCHVAWCMCRCHVAGCQCGCHVAVGCHCGCVMLLGICVDVSCCRVSARMM